MEIDKHSEEIYTCFECRCHYCREGCPVYSATKNETYSPAGKMMFAMAILQGIAQYTEETADYLAHCALCGHCKERCPSNRHLGDFYKKTIDPSKIVQAMRADVVKRLKAGKSEKKH